LPEAVLLDTITKAGELDGKVVMSGSHGGRYAAYLAVRAQARAVVLHDAGVGLDEAGVACIAYCQQLGIASATVDHMSARIGDVHDMLRRGRISRANAIAAALGVAPGIPVEHALALLQAAPWQPVQAPAYAEGRCEVSLLAGAAPVLCLDSASMVVPEHAGRIIATGSHGGLVGGDPAAALRADGRAALYNDAGIGIDQAGTTRLPALQRRGIAAVTVAAMSARIGEARSTLCDGSISVANAVAEQLGARPGMPARDWVAALLREE
jgi:hypothetical protein